MPLSRDIAVGNSQEALGMRVLRNNLKLKAFSPALVDEYNFDQKTALGDLRLPPFELSLRYYRLSCKGLEPALLGLIDR